MKDGDKTPINGVENEDAFLWTFDDDRRHEATRALRTAQIHAQAARLGIDPQTLTDAIDGKPEAEFMLALGMNLPAIIDNLDGTYTHYTGSETPYVVPADEAPLECTADHDMYCGRETDEEREIARKRHMQTAAYAAGKYPARRPTPLSEPSDTPYIGVRRQLARTLKAAGGVLRAMVKGS